MHCVVLFLIPCLIVQNALSREISTVNEGHIDQTNRKQQLDVPYTDLMIFENRQRSITDLWSQIKTSAQIAWNSLKTLVQKTKEKIATWAHQVKNRADAILETVKEKFTQLGNKIKTILANVLGNENVQGCIKNNTENFDDILREIINKVSLCISDKLSGISALEDSQVKDIPNDTEYMQEIEKKLNQCTQSTKNVEECLLDVRMDIIKETEDIADEVLQMRLVSRGLTDDILDAIMTCSTDGLIEATAVVSTEAINIIQCIVVHHGEPGDTIQYLKVLDLK